MQEKPIYVYIAGPLTPTGRISNNSAIEYLSNIRSMVRAGINLLLLGFTPYIPAIDFPLFLLLREGEELGESIIKEYSLNWMLRCDAVLLIDGWETSAGTIHEMEVAKKNNIPIFKTIDDLRQYFMR